MQEMSETFDPWGRFPWRRKWQPTPVFLPGKAHGQRGLAGCSSQGSKESDTTEVTKLNWTDWSNGPLYASGAENSNLLQYSCLENPMDRGAWRALVHGVTKSWTQLSTSSDLLCALQKTTTATKKSFFNPKQNLGMQNWKYNQRK